jgi:hypothetical protein
MTINLSISLPMSNVQVHEPIQLIVRPRRELLTPLSNPGEFLLVIDNSSIETFTTCPTYAMYHLVYAREAHARNAALTFGGAVHVGMECIEKLEGRPLPHLSTNRSTDRMWDETHTAQSVLKYFTENPTPPDEYRTPTCALEVLAHYRVRKTFPDYQWRVLSDNQGLLVERPFELPLGVLEVNEEIQLPNWPNPQLVRRIHVAWSGRIDLVVESNMRNRICDHKTTSIAGDQFVQDFQLSNATIGYLWAAQQLWPDLDISGFVLNAIHLKRHKPGTPLTVKGPRGGDPPLNFFRAYFDYTPERVKQWEENALVLVEDFVHCMVRNFYPLHTKWCMSKYGKCQYWDVCTIDDSRVRLKMLQSDAFKDVTWNPTADR